MEHFNLNKTMCEEIFGGELDVTEETPYPFETDKSQVRQYRNWLHQRNEQQLEILSKVESALEKMENFSRSKKNMLLPNRDGIQRPADGTKMFHKKQREATHCLRRGSWIQGDGPSSHPPDRGWDRRPGSKHWSRRRRGGCERFLRARVGDRAHSLLNEETLQGKQKGFCFIRGGKSLETSQGGPHQNWLAILQGSQEERA